MSIRFVLTVAVAAGAGCAAAPPVEPPRLTADVPSTWTAVSDALPDAVESDWWSSFSDPGLTEAVTTALQSNFDLQAAAARLEQAAADARVAGAGLKPTVQASYNGLRRKQNFVGFPIPGAEGRVLSTVFTNHGTSLDVSWEIDLWRRLRADAQAALADLQGAAADLRGAQLSLAGQTTKVWFAIAEAQQQVLLSETSVESFRESAELVQERFESGIRPALDLRLALLNLANAEALLDQRRQQLDSSRRQLDVLLGRYAAGDVEPPENLPAVPSSIPGGLPATLVARRPDLVAAERRVAAADARLSSARRQLLPGITLTATTGTATDALLSLLSGDFAVWSFVGNVVAPLWQGGRLRAQISRAEAQAAEVLSAYVNTALTAYAEVETALAADRFYADRAGHLETAVEQARAAERLAGERYLAGLDNYITVLESQRSAVQAEGDLIAARRLRLENRVDLYLALGGGFEQLPAPITLGAGDAGVTGAQ